MIKKFALSLLGYAISLYRYALARELIAAQNEVAAVEVRLERNYEAQEILNAQFSDTKRAQREACDKLKAVGKANAEISKKLEALQ